MVADDPQPDPSNLNMLLYNVVSRISYQLQQNPTFATALQEYDDQNGENRDRQFPL